MDRYRDKIDEIDQKMGELFSLRMDLVKEILTYKKAHELPIFDFDREKEVLAKNLSHVCEEYQPYYSHLIKEIMELSKEYQRRLLDE